MKRELGQTVQPNPEETVFTEKVDEWVAGKISYEDVINHYPSHNLDPVQRVARRVSRKAKQLASRLNRSGVVE